MSTTTKNKRSTTSKNVSKPKPILEETEVLELKDNTSAVIDNSSTIDETKLIEEFVESNSTENQLVYHIRIDWNNTATQKGSFTDINEAIRECNNYPGYKVFTEKGRPIHFSTAVIRITSNIAVAYTGKKYELNMAKLFASSTINVAKAIISGTFYLYDAQLINGRYRIVDNKSKINKGIQFISGYVAVEEM